MGTKSFAIWNTWNWSDRFGHFCCSYPTHAKTLGLIRKFHVPSPPPPRSDLFDPRPFCLGDSGGWFFDSKGIPLSTRGQCPDECKNGCPACNERCRACSFCNPEALWQLGCSELSRIVVNCIKIWPASMSQLQWYWGLLRRLLSWIQNISNLGEANRG